MKPGGWRALAVAAVLVSALAVSAWYKQRPANLQEASRAAPGTSAAATGKTLEPRPAGKETSLPRERPERDRTDRPTGH